jgi:hypothetical protein
MRMRGFSIAGPCLDGRILSDPSDACNLQGLHQLQKAVGSYIEPIEWAPVHSSIAGPDIFVISEGFLVDTS